MTDPVPSQPKGFFASIHAWQHRRKRRRKEKTRALMEKYREVLRQRAINPPPKGFFPKMRAIFAKMRENEKQRKARVKEKHREYMRRSGEKQRKSNERYKQQQIRHKRKQRWINRYMNQLPNIEAEIKKMEKNKDLEIVKKFITAFFSSFLCIFFTGRALDMTPNPFIAIMAAFLFGLCPSWLDRHKLRKLKRNRKKLLAENKRTLYKDDSKKNDELKGK